MLAWCLCGPGCVSEPLSVRAPRLPFDVLDTERRFLGPVGLHNVMVSVEIGPNDAAKEINIYPPGIVMVGDRVVVSKDPDRHFFFRIDERDHLLKKGSDVYIFNAPREGGIRLAFHGLALTLLDRPGREIVVVIRKDGAEEELRHGQASVTYDGRRFLRADGSEVPAAWRAQGVRMPRDGELEGL